jgi:predicted N-acetyltransferase YhbS
VAHLVRAADNHLEEEGNRRFQQPTTPLQRYRPGLWVRKALQECRETGQEVVVALGHPAFYPRFHFVPAKPLGIRWKFDASEDAFMVLELHEGALAGHTGVVKYQPEFTEA